MRTVTILFDAGVVLMAGVAVYGPAAFAGWVGFREPSPLWAGAE